MSFKKGYTPWNKGLKGFKHSGSFKKGHTPWDKGKKRPEFSKKILGKNNPAYRNGKYKNVQGYVMVLRKGGGYILEHRLVMEKHLGRKLESWEYIHHKNGRRDDNRIKNLSIVISKKHFGQVRCPHCLKEFLIK